MAMAMGDSVTVSMAALSRGILILIFRVRFVEIGNQEHVVKGETFRKMLDGHRPSSG
jgi:hypothetical protein